MKHLFIILSCLLPCLCSAQTFSGEYTAEWQWDMKRNTNWLNLLRLNLNVPVFDGKGTIEASTLHIAKTNETIIADWQTFSNIEAENNVAAVAKVSATGMPRWAAPTATVSTSADCLLNALASVKAPSTPLS